MKHTLFIFAVLLFGGSTALALAGGGQQVPAPIEGPVVSPTSASVERFITPTIGGRWTYNRKTKKWSNILREGHPAVFEGTSVIALAFQWAAEVGHAPGGRVSVLVLGYRTRQGAINLNKAFFFESGADDIMVGFAQWRIRKDNGFVEFIPLRGHVVSSGENQTTGVSPTPLTEGQRLLKRAVVVRRGESLQVKGMPLYTCKASTIDVLCSVDAPWGRGADLRLYTPWTPESYTLRVYWGNGSERVREQGTVPPPPETEESP